MTKFIYFSILFFAIGFNVFAQTNPSYKIKKIGPSEQLKSKDFTKGNIDEISFILLIDSKELPIWEQYISKNIVDDFKPNCSSSLNLMHYEMSTSSKKDPIVDGKKIDSQYFFLVTNSDFDINKINIENTIKSEIELSIFYQSNTTITYLLKAPGKCLNPTGAFGGKIKELITNYNSKFCREPFAANSQSNITPQSPATHYLSFSANYNLGPKLSNSINTNSQKYTSNLSSKSGFGLGIDYHFIVSYKENENISHEIATGIHFVNNNFLLSADSVQFNYSQTDKDGEKYQRRIYGINIKEEANINFFDVPLYYTFNYKLNEKAKVYVKGGLQFMYIFSATYSATDGEFSYRGKYKGIKDEFENINEYDFYENQQVIKNTHNLDVKKFNTYGSIGGGFKCAIDKKTDFAIGVNVNIAGSNLLKQKTDTYITSQTASDYSSLLYSFNKFKINPISFEFGLISKF
jgi:hypothetical protein